MVVGTQIAIAKILVDLNDSSVSDRHTYILYTSMKYWQALILAVAKVDAKYSSYTLY